MYEVELCEQIMDGLTQGWMDDGKTGKTSVWHRMEQIMGNTLTRRANIFEYCTDLSAYAVLLEKKKRRYLVIDSHLQ